MTQDTPEYNSKWWRGAGRAVRLLCPRCGRGKVFRRFVLMNETCPGCNLAFDRGDGYWLGSMTINMGVAMGMVVVVFALTLLLTSPDPNWDLAIVLVVTAALVTPLVFFPFSRTLWIAAERAARLRDDTESK